VYRVILFDVNTTEEIWGVLIKYIKIVDNIKRIFFAALTDTGLPFSTFICLSVFKELKFLVFPNNYCRHTIKNNHPVRIITAKASAAAKLIINFHLAPLHHWKSTTYLLNIRRLEWPFEICNVPFFWVFFFWSTTTITLLYCSCTVYI